MMQRLASFFARHPLVNVLVVIAMFAGLGVMDGFRIAEARNAMDTTAWSVALVAGFVLAPISLTLLRVVLTREIGNKPRGGEKTILGGLFGWFLLFGVTHPRGHDELDQPWEIGGAIVADLLLVMFVTWASWNHLLGRPVWKARSAPGRRRANVPPSSDD